MVGEDQEDPAIPEGPNEQYVRGIQVRGSSASDNPGPIEIELPSSRFLGHLLSQNGPGMDEVEESVTPGPPTSSSVVTDREIEQEEEASRIESQPAKFAHATECVEEEVGTTRQSETEGIVESDRHPSKTNGDVNDEEH